MMSKYVKSHGDAASFDYDYFAAAFLDKYPFVGFRYEGDEINGYIWTYLINDLDKFITKEIRCPSGSDFDVIKLRSKIVEKNWEYLILKIKSLNDLNTLRITYPQFWTKLYENLGPAKIASMIRSVKDYSILQKCFLEDNVKIKEILEFVSSPHIEIIFQDHEDLSPEIFEALYDKHRNLFIDYVTKHPRIDYFKKILNLLEKNPAQAKNWIAFFNIPEMVNSIWDFRKLVSHASFRSEAYREDFFGILRDKIPLLIENAEDFCDLFAGLTKEESQQIISQYYNLTTLARMMQSFRDCISMMKFFGPALRNQIYMNLGPAFFAKELHGFSIEIGYCSDISQFDRALLLLNAKQREEVLEHLITLPTDDPKLSKYIGDAYYRLVTLPATEKRYGFKTYLEPDSRFDRFFNEKKEEVFIVPSQEYKENSASISVTFSFIQSPVQPRVEEIAKSKALDKDKLEVKPGTTVPSQEYKGNSVSVSVVPFSLLPPPVLEVAPKPKAAKEEEAEEVKPETIKVSCVFI